MAGGHKPKFDAYSATDAEETSRNTKRVCINARIVEALDELLRPPKWEVPVRERSFFKNLNRDVRNLIYECIELPPFSDGTNRDKNWSGIYLSCRQAKTELDEAREHALRGRLRNSKNETSPEFGIALSRERIWNPIYRGFFETKTLRVDMNGPLTVDPFLALGSLYVSKIHLHFTNSERPSARENLLADFLSVAKQVEGMMPNFPLSRCPQCLHFAISWNISKSGSKDRNATHRVEVTLYPFAGSPPRTRRMQTQLVDFRSQPSQIGDLNNATAVDHWKSEHGGEDWMKYSFDIWRRGRPCYASIELIDLESSKE